jgi:hypothetical protein
MLILLLSAGVWSAGIIKAFVRGSSGGGKSLVVKGECPVKDGYLGYSFYEKGCRDAAREGQHRVVKVGKGAFEKTASIDRKFYGGKYEAALWGKMVPKRSCRIPKCAWCAKNGFHMENSLGYTWGNI